MIGALVAAALVALYQLGRSRDTRLLVVAAMLTLQAAALFDGWSDLWRDAFQLGVCLAGLGLVLMLSRSPAEPTPRGAAPRSPDRPPA